MKLERRGSGAPEPGVEEEHASAPEKKPVIAYIMVLFIAAFLLMALSLVMHQRSNVEALGELQNSVGAMQEVQLIQEKVIALQEELSEYKDKLEETQSQLQEETEARAEQDQQLKAYQYLYCLQLQYLNEQYAACQETIQAFEDSGLTEVLTDQPLDHTVTTSPAVRYQQLKDAVAARLADAPEEIG